MDEEQNIETAIALSTTDSLNDLLETCSLNVNKSAGEKERRQARGVMAITFLAFLNLAAGTGADKDGVSRISDYYDLELSSASKFYRNAVRIISSRDSQPGELGKEMILLISSDSGLISADVVRGMKARMMIQAFMTDVFVAFKDASLRPSPGNGQHSAKSGCLALIAMVSGLLSGVTGLAYALLHS